MDRDASGAIRRGEERGRGFSGSRTRTTKRARLRLRRKVVRRAEDIRSPLLKVRSVVRARRLGSTCRRKFTKKSEAGSQVPVSRVGSEWEEWGVPPSMTTTSPRTSTRCTSVSTRTRRSNNSSDPRLRRARRPRLFMSDRCQSISRPRGVVVSKRLAHRPIPTLLSLRPRLRHRFLPMGCRISQGRLERRPNLSHLRFLSQLLPLA